MTIVGIDDTDSRERGMCTTYVAATIAERLRREESAVARLLLVRLNPAVEYKTRGNAALAIHTDCDPASAFAIARESLESLAETEDERTNPGLVAAGHDPAERAVPDEVGRFTRTAIRDHLEPADAAALIDRRGYRSWHAGDGRGRIGALAAVGAWTALEEWTREYISYREPDRWGTPRDVDHESVFAAAEWGYPEVWDTVDRGEDETVCVPHTPGPILHGIRGDDPDAVRAVAERIESEPVATSQRFVTNQGTDVHLRDGSIGDVEDGRAYRLEGRVASEPETRRGGHVFVDLESPREADARDENPESSDERLTCAAFEPTKRFRDRVRALRIGDRITACGEVSEGTLKLEKFAVRDLVETQRVTPTCPGCGRTMKSAGREQGYRCRDCGTGTDGKVERPLERDLEDGWYEVPPCARRHIAKPLVRGGFDAPTHPER
ncbi:tRNA(Ile)(2)-agmatinylcytidine synthase [Natrinema salsiterrestre]|uniref:tRNA(Ile2) 2-agmatinylcytidine synthetase TiaS n=1 Tax=Natrinema salsiterrestre TaxID=2950540 RepID=A0A9Q4L688_9EURY|nr:tRNA(Ile)(2)-agmatinylcytidine synthase [Natrinema salsiterrestre]MDF9746051.1 tRNA(Ile)(2)-agmatinylcytidine synthase [Natrinema salsiterrestre]